MIYMNNRLLTYAHTNYSLKNIHKNDSLMEQIQHIDVNHPFVMHTGLAVLIAALGIPNVVTSLVAYMHCKYRWIRNMKPKTPSAAWPKIISRIKSM